MNLLGGSRDPRPHGALGRVLPVAPHGAVEGHLCLPVPAQEVMVAAREEVMVVVREEVYLVTYCLNCGAVLYDLPTPARLEAR